jgi:hypothetical protein
MRSKRVKTSTGDAAPAHAAVAITDSSAPYLCREKERAHASADPGQINLSTHLHLFLFLSRALSAEGRRMRQMREIYAFRQAGDT